MSRHRLTFALALLILPLAISCSESEANARWTGTMEELPNGATLVQNRAVGVWGDDDGWRLVEELRIGAIEAEGPEQLGEIRGVQMDELGRIYVLDSHARQVKVFDAEGRHVRSFGKQGGGPGEFEEPAALLWGPDRNLWVVDQRNARFAVFDTTGTFVESHPRPGGIMFLPWPGGFDLQGNLYDIAVAGGPILDDGPRRPRPGGPMMGLARFSSSLQPIDTFSIPPHTPQTFELSGPGRVMIAAIPFAPNQVWRLSPQGDVWLGVTDRYRLHRVSVAGDTTRIVEKEFEPLPVTQADREASMENLQRLIDQGLQVDESRIPDTKPAFRNLQIDREGYLWVRPSGKVEEENHLFDIFDPDGRYLGRIVSPFPVTPVAPFLVRDNTLLTVTQDELGVSYVVRARIEGRG